MSVGTDVPVAAPPPLPDDVVGTWSGATIKVTRSQWNDVAPGLPAQLIQLVAPPVTVTVTAAGA